MVFSTVQIHNLSGLHLRAACLFSKTMRRYDAAVTLSTPAGAAINGKSMLELTAACIDCGTDITVACSGSDEDAMLSQAVALLNGFGDDDEH